jgi:hypothetical protein
LTLEPGDGSLWLRMTGPAGARAFLDAEFGPSPNAVTWSINSSTARRPLVD